MKQLILLFVMLNMLNASAQVIEHHWTHLFDTGASSFSGVHGMSITELGYVYTANSFGSNVWVGPGPYGTYIYSNGDEDILIDKTSGNNNRMWYKHIGGTGFDQASHIKQFSNGDLLITGVFSDTVDFDSGEDTVLKVSQGERDNFLLKLDKDGNYVDCITFGGSGDSYITDLILTENDEIFIAGWYTDSMNLSPSLVDHLHISDTGTNSFLSKFDANLNFVSGVSFEGNVTISDLFRTADGSLLFIGDFQEILNVQFTNEERVLHSAGMRDVFYGRFDGDFNVFDVASIESESDEIGMGIIQLENGRLVMQINFADYIDLGKNGEPFVVSQLYHDVVVVQPNVLRNTLLVCFNESEDVVWFKRFSGVEPGAKVYPKSKFILDNQGNLLVSYFLNWRCGLGEGNFGIIGVQGWRGSFLMSINHEGTIRWMREFDCGYQGTGEVHAMECHQQNLYVGGQMTGDVDFDLSVGYGFEYGWQDPFLVKYTLHDQFLLTDEMLKSESLVFPNPVNEQLFLYESYLDQLQLFDLTGRLIEANYFFNGKSYQINTSELSNGAYTLVYSKDNKRFNQKFLVQH